MSTHEQLNWHYASQNGEERLGPVSIRELSELAGQGAVGPKTLVWSPGYPEWVPAEKIADLLTEARVADVPTPASPPATDVVHTSAPPQDLKPRKFPFVVPRIISGLIASCMIAGVTGVGLAVAEKSPWPAVAVLLAGSALAFIASFVAYRKERYQIDDARLVCHRGGLVSDQTTEFDVRNITHVKLKLPWLRHKFFGVGNVIVQTAGNSKPMEMRGISAPDTLYAGLRDRMKKNGYDLTQQQLLHEERPALIGIIGECMGLFGGAIMVALFFLSAIFGGSQEAAQAPPDIELLAIPGIGVLLVILAFVVVRFLDLRRRTYRVYNDVVVYDEGFLTRENAFIPYENIADANTKCTLLDRIFGLYDVQISCQGSSSEIKFRRLRHGVALSAAIDQLVVFARQKKKPASRSTAAGETAVASQDRFRRAEPESIPIEETLVGDFRMNAARTMVPLLVLLPLIPLWIAAMIQAGIRLVSTQYSVRHGSVRHSYRFLTLHDREFAYDKITGVVIKQNLWDRMFGTMTLKFWSIGSGKPLEFAHISSSQLNLAALMRQAGIPDASPEPCELIASFGVVTWLRANLKYLPLPLLFAAGVVFAAIQIGDPIIYYLLALPVLVCLGACIRSKIYHSRQRLRFHEHHIEAGQGVISRSRYYARYSNVKRTQVTRYPGGSEGTLEIFVAAEEEVGQLVQQQPQAKSRQTIMKHCSFTTGFLADVREKGLLLDDILCGRVEPAPDAVAAAPLDVLLEARRSVGSALVKLIFLSNLVFPLIALLPITLPATVIRIKRWRYRVDAARVVMSWGIFYQRETSILLDRVDSLQQSQGPLNKLFRNGDVSIMTAGSSKPDLRIIDSPGYLPLYQLIRERSQ